MTVNTYAQIGLVVILMHIRAKFPFIRSNMSSVRQNSIHFVPVFLFICALAPATERIAGFLLKFRDRVPHINRQLKIALFRFEEIRSGGELEEGRTDQEVLL